MVVGHFPLLNKSIIITGGGSGINLAFVKLALQHGAKHILIADLRLTPEAQNLLTSNPSNLAFVECDVTNWSHLESLPNVLQNKFGFGSEQVVADIWIAGAGIFDGSSFAYDYADKKSVIENGYLSIRINTEHPMKLTRIAMRSALSSNKPAVVLIVASYAGVYGQYASAIYCASKHAVVGFTKSMAQADIDEDVRVVCILPGMVSTPLWTDQKARREFEQFGFQEENCLGPEEVAEGMREMIEDGGKWEGGSLMGIEKGGDLRRRLESRQAIEIEGEEGRRWEDNAYGPIREIFRSERGGLAKL